MKTLIKLTHSRLWCSYILRYAGKELCGSGGRFWAVQLVALLALTAQAQVPDSFNPAIFPPELRTSVYAIAVQPDGKVLIGGVLTNVAGLPQNLARLNPNGTLDTAFNPTTDGPVYSLLVQPDGKILVGGSFSNLCQQARTCVGRLNADGTLDPTFNAGIGTHHSVRVHSLVPQADGRLFIGGGFAIGSQLNLARVHPDGSLDTTFRPVVNGIVRCVSVQSDGKLLVGGSITGFGSLGRNAVGRLNADGTLDTAFNPGVTGESVGCIAIQADGRILLGGNFTKLGGQIRNFIGRVNPDSTLDSTFNPGASDRLYTLAVQADGKILAGGNFKTLGGQAHLYLELVPKSRFSRRHFETGTDLFLRCIDGNFFLGIQTKFSEKVWFGTDRARRCSFRKSLVGAQAAFFWTMVASAG